MIKRIFIKKVSLAILILVSCSISCCFFEINLVKASGQYANKELIPGQESTSDFIVYLRQLYVFGIGFAAVLAAMMISFGAFVYIVTSAGNVAKMTDAKEMIFNAIYGLVLALLAYLILSLINIDLVSGKIRTAPPVSYFERSYSQLV